MADPNTTAHCQCETVGRPYLENGIERCMECGLPIDWGPQMPKPDPETTRKPGVMVTPTEVLYGHVETIAAIFFPRPDCPKCKGSGVAHGLPCDCIFPRDSEGKPQ